MDWLTDFRCIKFCRKNYCSSINYSAFPDEEEDRQTDRWDDEGLRHNYFSKDIVLGSYTILQTILQHRFPTRIHWGNESVSWCSLVESVEPSMKWTCAEGRPDRGEQLTYRNPLFWAGHPASVSHSFEMDRLKEAIKKRTGGSDRTQSKLVSCRVVRPLSVCCSHHLTIHYSVHSQSIL